MKTKPVCLLFAILMITAVNGQKSTRHVKINAGAILPGGAWGTYLKTGFEVNGSLYAGATQRGSWLFNAGINSLNDKLVQFKAGYLMLLAGYRYQAAAGIYAEGSGGMAIGIMQGTRKDLLPALNLAAGYLIKTGKKEALDIYIKFTNAFGTPKSNNWIGIGLGYQFQMKRKQ
jgi:hypothetical protein